MFNKRSLWTLLSVLLLVLLIAAQCQPATPAAPPAEEVVAEEEPAEEAVAEEEPAEEAMHPALEDGVITIAWIPKALNNPVFELGRDGAFVKAEELTAQGPYEVEIQYVGSVASDMAEQARVMEDMIAQGVDAIGVSCNDPDGCIDPINKAIEAGIEVMTWDSDAPDSERFTYLGVSNYDGGRAAADLLVRAMGEEGKVALLTGVPGALNLEERIRGFEDVIAENYPGIEIVTTVACYDDINQGVQVVEETMQAYPDLDGWFFVGLWPLFAERGSMPLWEAASESGQLKNVVFDTLPIELEYMKDGLVHGLVGQKYWGWGYDTVQMIYDKMVEGATYDDWTDSGMDIVTMNNVDAMIEAWETSDFTKPLPPAFDEVEEAPAAAEGELLVVSAPCENNKIKEIAALDDMSVQFTLCKPDPAFLAKVAFTPFFIQPREWIEEKAGTTELLEHPIGTAPYYIDSWNRGDSIVFKRFDDYWGEPAKTETLVFRWSTEGAARLLELQAGTADHIVKLSPDDYETVRNDPNLQFLPVPNPNIMYLAMTNTFEPWGDPNVRKAIALGIDRQRLVDNFYPEGSVVASHFTPCSIPNGCQGEEWYEFDPEAARALLAEAGYPDGFETAIYYRDVFRVYLPEPGLVAQDIQAQLKENLNIDADVVVMESGEFIDESTNGRLDGLYMLGWGADYLHVTNFLDFHFSRSNPQFGDPHPEIYEVLEEASTIADETTAAPLYEQANNNIKELIPMVPVAHGAPADAALGDVDYAHTSVLGPPLLWKTTPGDRDTLVYLKAAEPISLYCMDETDGESLDACKMVTEGLYVYDEFGVAQPTLATECTANEDATVWTCMLRDGVTFHDGSTVDANDVVRSWDAGVNAASPYHIGNTGAFEYPSYLFDALMNLEE